MTDTVSPSAATAPIQPADAFAAAAGDAARPAYRWVILALIMLVMTTSFTIRFAWSAAAVKVGDEMNFDATTLGSFVTAFFVGYVITNAVSGYLSDRFGARIMICAGMVPLAMLVAAFGLMTSAPAGLLIQLGMGLTAGVNYSSCIKLTATWFDSRERGLALGIRSADLASRQRDRIVQLFGSRRAGKARHISGKSGGMTDNYMFAPTVSAVPVEGTDALFPVRRIYCVGRNYAEHIREMGGDERQPPFFFQKPADAIVHDGATIPYPPATSDFQHEIELVLAIGKGGAGIDAASALDHVCAIATGIDLMRRDVQVQAREAGRPWEIGKAFDHSAPISALRPIAVPAAGVIGLTVNGVERQKGDLAEMIWTPAEIISRLSQQYRLEPGDLIYTGTPAGVGPVDRGDVIKGYVQGVGSLTITIA